MIGRLQCVVLDCPDARALAGFYQELLGGELNRPDPRWTWSEEAEWATLHLPADRPSTGFVLAFQRVHPYLPPSWPDPERPQQSHLDVEVADLPTAHTRAVAAGATLLDDGDGTRAWRVYADPAGHPFCLIRR